MTDPIPDDIRKKAETIGKSWVRPALRMHAVAAIAQALMQERERRAQSSEEMLGSSGSYIP